MTSSSVRATVQKIRHIGDAAREAFIDREDFVRAMELSMVAGLHCIVLGAPGTGKSAGLRYMADATGLGFFKKLMNPDLPREELCGPIDPVALQKGQWRRVWLGLATEPLVFIDEIGKASGQVVNMLLDAMEERVVSVADIEQDIPLHCLTAASNETITESPAIWNRFSIRLVVHKIDQTRHFKRLIKDAWKTKEPPSVPISIEELVEVREAVYRMATKAYESPKFERTLLKIFAGFDNVGSLSPSPRQWLNVIILACGNALLNGRTQPIAKDLEIAWYGLWDDPEEIEQVRAFIEDTIGEEDKELETAKTVLSQMTESYTNMSGSNIEGLGTLSFRAKQLLRECEERHLETKEDDWSDLALRVEELVQAVERKGSEMTGPNF